LARHGQRQRPATGDDHPFAAVLAGDLAAAGVRTLAFEAP
jgi:hypothetical protein